MSWLWFGLAGLAAGILSGMGMGGGTVLIPILTLVLGVSQHAAQGMNMLAFLPGAMLALYIHFRDKRLDIPSGLQLLWPGIVGAILGAFLATLLSADWLRRGFGGFLIVLAIVQFLSGEKDKKK